MDNTMVRWFSMKEIMEYLGVSRDMVLMWIDKYQMPASRVGRLWKFKVGQRCEYMDGVWPGIQLQQVKRRCRYEL